MPEKNVTWLQVNNIVPLVGSAIMISASFFALSNKVDSVKQDVGYIKENTSSLSTDVKNGDSRINNHETRISILESKRTSFSGQSVQLASRVDITPTPQPTQLTSPQVQQSVVIQQPVVKPTPQPTPQPNQQEEPEPTPEPIITIPIISHLLERL